MSQGYETSRPAQFTLADQASVDVRAQFIVRVYAHLFLAVTAFALLEAVLLQLPITDRIMERMIGGGAGMSWLLVLGAFMLVSTVANRWAHSDTSLGRQYAGLGLYVVGEAIIFVPLLYMAAFYGGAGVIPTAAIVTGCVFTGLTSVVFFTRKNFSFLQPFLGVLGMAAMGLIVVSILFGFSLGILFTVAMIAFAAAYILFTTSNILHEYRTDQYVAASLALFASVALLFWYILQLFMSRD